MFKVNFDIKPSVTRINLASQIYLTGSCFSDEIGGRLTANKFNCLSNPFGPIYNPISIFQTLSENIDLENIVENQGVYYHWDCHGVISGVSKNEAVESVQTALASSLDFLNNTDFLFITLGTSHVYREKASNKIVANCHKVPSQNFTKELLNKDHIVSSFQSLHKKLKPNLNVIFTVSPVRHLRDGLIENNLSKAILIESVHELTKSFENVSYFPSYEIVIDELRDYRFYKNDLSHPNELAIDYVWDRFNTTYFDDETIQFILDWGKIKHAVNHKPLQPTSKQHQAFLKKTLIQLESFKDKIDISKESEMLQKQML